jgi:hypothetical protein
MNRAFLSPTNPDVHAFHEAFAVWWGCSSISRFRKFCGIRSRPRAAMCGRTRIFWGNSPGNSGAAPGCTALRDAIAV